MRHSFCLLDDNCRSFLYKVLGSKFGKLDLDTFFSFPHEIIGCISKDDEILIAFFCVMIVNNKRYGSYSWCEKSFRGKRAILDGIDFILESKKRIEFIGADTNSVVYRKYKKRKETIWEQRFK